MPITKQAIKRMRSNERRAERNVLILSRIKTLYKTFAKHVAAKDVKAATEQGRLVVREYDAAASKGVIPKKRADRKKTRIANALNKLATANSNN